MASDSWRETEEEHEERYRKHREDQDDWRGVCQKCGKQISGKLNDVRTHRCDRTAEPTDTD